MNIFRRALGLVAKHLRPFLLVNLVYFGLVGSGMAYGAWDKEYHDAVKKNIQQEVPKSLPAVVDAYQGGHLAKAIGWTFGVNLIAGAFLVITFPSLLVPFSGLAIGAFRAVMWGLLFAPDFSAFGPTALARGLLIGLLVLLEGEGYVLAMLGAYLHGKSFVLPQSAGLATRWQGYKTGAAQAMQLYPLIAGVLAVAAVYEAVIAIYVMPLLK